MCARQDVVTWKGQLFFEDKAEPEPRALPGSLVAFTRNGQLQGVAYRRAFTCICATGVHVTCHGLCRPLPIRISRGEHTFGW